MAQLVCCFLLLIVVVFVFGNCGCFVSNKKRCVYTHFTYSSRFRVLPVFRSSWLLADFIR